MPQLFLDLREFVKAWWVFLSTPTKQVFGGFETAKSTLAESLYRQRGKLARPFVHSGMVALSAVGVMIAPIISDQLPGNTQISAPSSVLSAATENPEMSTLISDKPRDRVIDYEVQSGDTLSTISEKFGVSQDTILWQNSSLTKKTILKPGQTLKILPVTGIAHKVSRGETIYSIAKKYQAEPQAIVDFPFNTFVNDETFALAVGQDLIIPDGVPPKEVPPPTRFARITPDAGTVTASGIFVWPASGRISQGFLWYHRGIDIANRDAPDVLAADSGTVIVAGWPDNGGYGNRVIIDHGNGYQTLYSHLSLVYVRSEPGKNRVNKGAPIGKMGSTGRSTGTHLHFEVKRGDTFLNPLEFLR